jgi:7-cyano-7-deazaguanine reductase
MCPMTEQPDFAHLVIDYVPAKWLRIGDCWFPRGGVPIDVYWQTGAPPKAVWIPEQGVQPYCGRG